MGGRIGRVLLMVVARGVLLAGCSGGRTGPVTRGVERAAENLEPGLQLFPTARDFDRPGQVIRIDQDRVWRRVIDLGDSLRVDARAEAAPAVFSDSRLRAGMALTFLGAPVSAGLEAARRTTFAMRIEQPRREIVQEAALRPVVNRALPQINPFVPGNQYYVISEALLADSVDITLTSASVDSLGGSATIKNIVRANPALSLRDSAASVLRMRFPKPLRVFYKAVAITPEGGVNLGGGRRAESVTLVPVGTLLDVVRADTAALSAARRP